MITGELKSKIDRIWAAFWTGGIANPLEVIEQITYLLFIRRLDDLQTARERKATRTGRAIEKPIFPSGEDDAGRPYSDLRWSHFKHMEPGEMYAVIEERVFPFLRALGGDGSTYSHHMQDARFTIPTPALLAQVVGMIAEMPMEGRDTKGDLYEYMLSKIATAGQNGQFRTPRHIIALMVEMTAPAAGATRFAIRPAAPPGSSSRRASTCCGNTRTSSDEARASGHFHKSMFHGFDFDWTMLRIGSMNMLLHGVEEPDIRYRDSLSRGRGRRGGAVLADPRQSAFRR